MKKYFENNVDLFYRKDILGWVKSIDSKTVWVETRLVWFGTDLMIPRDGRIVIMFTIRRPCKNRPPRDQPLPDIPPFSFQEFARSIHIFITSLPGQKKKENLTGFLNLFSMSSPNYEREVASIIYVTAWGRGRLNDAAMLQPTQSPSEL